jgi:hypothetical protein
MIEMVIDQPILFNKSNKKVRSEKMVDYLIPQIKQPIKYVWYGFRVKLQLRTSQSLSNTLTPELHTL